jgi:alkanesulfonate monooxygenase SsuD/methylene tetrahydromethanopterin reductase-like flavin-dependent oxidoreductase (luciferase family)
MKPQPETRRVSIGLLLPTREMAIAGDEDVRRLLRFAWRAEALGFDSLWAGDSLTARPRFEPLTILAAIAACTERIRLGTAALTAALRPPLSSAHALSTLDCVAGGRLTLGLGAGFPYPASEAEFAAMGVPFEQRIGRLLDTVRAWRAIWNAAGAEAPASYAGRYVSYDGIERLPAPAQPGGPPLWLAGGDAPGVLRRVGRYFDGWMPYLPDAAAYARGWREIGTAARAAGRDPSRLTAGLYVTVAIHPDRDAAVAQLDDYVTRYYGMPLAMMQSLQAFFAGSAADCAAWLAGYLRAGARHVIVRIGSLEPELHAQAVADAVLPLRNGLRREKDEETWTRCEA